MIVYLLLGLFIGIPIGVISNKYFIPFCDTKLEKHIFKESVVCTGYQLEANAMVQEYEDAYGDNRQELQPCVGFSYDPPMEEIYDDEEDRLKNKIKIGFHNN